MAILLNLTHTTPERQFGASRERNWISSLLPVRRRSQTGIARQYDRDGCQARNMIRVGDEMQLSQPIQGPPPWTIWPFHARNIDSMVLRSSYPRGASSAARRDGCTLICASSCLMHSMSGSHNIDMAVTVTSAMTAKERAPAFRATGLFRECASPRGRKSLEAHS
jgi:hypothetical protein